MKNTHNLGLLGMHLAIAATLFGAALPIVTLAQSQNGLNSYVYTDKQSLLLMPAARVSDDTATLTWSPDSERLLTFSIQPLPVPIRLDAPEQSPPASDLIIGRYVRGGSSADRSGHYSDVVWQRRFPTEPTLVAEPTWIPQTQSIAQIVLWHEKENVKNDDGTNRVQLRPFQELLWINAARSTVHEVHMEVGDYLTVSPTRSYAVMVNPAGMYSDKQSSLIALKLDGAEGSPLPLPVHTGVTNTQWSTAGDRLLVTMSKFKPDRKGVINEVQVFDPVTGELSPVKSPVPETPRLPQKPQINLLRLKSTQQNISDGGITAVVHPLWAETTTPSEKSKMLVCSDADLGILSPDGTAIAYRSQRSSWVSEVTPVPLAEFKVMIAKAMRQMAMSNGKQLALASLLWAQDHDENLPTPDNINNELAPYIVNQSLLDQFNYTYTGGALANIQSPAETIIGTVDGPGGQAVMYADGHVKWRDR